MKSLRNLLVVAGIVVFSVYLAPAQEKIRSLEHGRYRQYDLSTEPIAIVGRRLGNRRFIDERTVVGSPDWLQHLVLEVMNISNKTINGLAIDLVIPKQGDMSVDHVMTLSFPDAREPVIDEKRSPTVAYRTTNVLKPGEMANLSISKNQLRMLEVVKSKGVFDIERVSLSFRQVTFDDGTKWYQGVNMREDPLFPGSWRPIESLISLGRTSPNQTRVKPVQKVNSFVTEEHQKNETQQRDCNC